jgi:hypothetical protein
MRKLLYLAVFLALCGLAKAANVSCGIDVYKSSLFPVEEGEQIKRIMPKYSDLIDSYIVALKQGATASYKTQIWLSQDDTPIRSAYVIKPNAETVTLKNDRPRHFSYKNDGPGEFLAIEDLKLHWPSGDYELHVTFTNGTTQTLTTTVPDYDTTPFPDFVTGSLSADASGLLSLDWSTVNGISEYRVWVWTLKTNKGVYESDDLYIPTPQSQTTPLPGAYVGKYDLNIGVDEEKTINNGPFSVSFISVTNWFSLKKQWVPIVNSIDKFTVKAGLAGTSKDSVIFTGMLDAIAADLIIAKGGDVVVTLNAADAIEFKFPINDSTLKKGLFSNTVNGSTFKFNTWNGKMTFSAKNIDLKRLECPIDMSITIGDYETKFQVEEDTVNGGKALSLALMMGVTDSIKISKATVKHATTPDADSLTVTGTFTIAGSYDKINDFAVDFGKQTFTIPGNQMNKKGLTIEICSKVPCNEGGLMTAKLDFAKCTFTITLTGVNLDTGEQSFGLDVFDHYLEGTYINDRFAGTLKSKLYGNNNLGDGFTLETENVTAVISTSNKSDYELKAKGMPTYTLSRTSDILLELDPQPQNFPDWIQTNMCMLSDGSNRAFFVIGKDPAPLDVGISAASWTRSVTVTTSQLAGTWTITWIYDNDLLADVLGKYDTASENTTITDLGNGQVSVQGDLFFSGSTTMKIAKNNLVPTGAPGPSIRYFSMTTDGDGISIAVIEVNPLDDTDVAARIGLAARVP